MIEKLLVNVSVSVFMREYFLRLPFSHPGECGHFPHLGSPEIVERLLVAPGADLLAAREGLARSGPPPQSLADVRSLLDEGFTLRIRHVERHDKGLADLAAAFVADFSAPIDIQLYWTPANHPGFGWHYDPEDVFVLQTFGAKEWEVRKNTVNPWPLIENLPENMRYEREIMPLWRCSLAAGDWLYIPNGYWHRTRASTESISLSVGVLSPVALDLYDFLRNYLLTDLRWRQRLPPIGAASHMSGDELLSAYQELCEELGNDLQKLLRDQSFAKQFLAKRSSGSN